MHPVVRRGRRWHFCALAVLATVTVLTPRIALPAPTKLLVFGAKPNATVEIRKNTNLVATVPSTPLGTVAADADGISGDRFEILGPETAPPVPPLFTSLATNTPGCATAAWLPSGDPTVIGYRVSFGTLSVAGGDAAVYGQSVDVGASTLHTECALLPARYYFAVQTRNADGGLSTYSGERSVVIQSLAVLFASFDAAVSEEGVRLAWRVEADEVVLGYRVYRSEGTAPEVRLTPSLLGVSTNSFMDVEARAGRSYTYFVTAVKENGDEVRSVAASVTTAALALALGQNYPNPFNPSTKIPFTLESTGQVVVRVFDVRGAQVATLFDGTLGEGRHSLAWSGRGDDGRPVASGLYFYSLTAGQRTLSRKMLLMK
jgi:hypothetical protein